MNNEIEKKFLKSITKKDVRIKDGLYNLNDMGLAAQLFDITAKSNAHPSKWMQSDTTKNILKHLEVKPNSASPIYMVISTGDNSHRGVWGNLQVATQYLQWVSPLFAAHVTDTYVKLLCGELQVKEKEIANHNKDINELNKEIKRKDEIIGISGPVTRSHLIHQDAGESFNITAVAADMTRLPSNKRNAEILNLWLCHRGIIKKVDKNYILHNGNINHFTEVANGTSKRVVRVTLEGRNWILDNQEAIFEYAMSGKCHRDAEKNEEFWLIHHARDKNIDYF